LVTSQLAGGVAGSDIEMGTDEIGSIVAEALQ
jgi:hypothetical protein